MIDPANKEQSCRNIADAIASIMPEGCPHPDWGKEAFLRSLAPDSRILDLGCGNNSPRKTKDILPGCHYIGLDVGDYNQTDDIPADEYIVVNSDMFKNAIDGFADSIDAVISAHNIEHCDDRYGVAISLARSLKIGGKAYISFPAYDSIAFPNRVGTLNYYDDGGHVGDPPNFGKIISILVENGLNIIYASTRYQPPIHWILGLGTEQSSQDEGVIKDGTWCYWGFESVIWAERT